ncbi:hypothetical protein jhhlp_007873 [Lomentospora prolificans]|uniref:DUF676 domain-containing protein n=1 Tax=Lomentospora prolificans TaxID=41688 RepID=A0A2N3N0T4_9PEZI|nr:hypothetical protein jhhlp_007873 [Lomentospora prolificans]
MSNPKTQRRQTSYLYSGDSDSDIPEKTRSETPSTTSTPRKDDDAPMIYLDPNGGPPGRERVRKTRIKSRESSGAEKSSLKIKIELDLEVELNLYARIKGDVTISLIIFIRSLIKMSRTLLLCFIHGFKGTDDTFRAFPDDLKKRVSEQLPDHRVESVVYPKYETKGDLSQASEAFLEWGFVAADTLFLALNERASGGTSEAPIFPLIQGILTFDTPYNGLARSMFVYGAFSNYQKVSNVFNVMSTLSVAAPAGLSRLAAKRAAGRAAAASGPSSSPAWKAWQLVAVRTGTVGAIAAGGVAAYMHREAIIKGLRSVKNLNKESIIEGYQQGVGALGQGLAYINRGNVGQSYAWLSGHFTFVGALLKPNELSRRLERLAALQGVGVHDIYCSLGENGYWSGGYFVPERTFCAIPEPDHAAYRLFSRYVIGEARDEIQAHLGMFQPKTNSGYERMTEEAAKLATEWFLSEKDIVDDAKFRDAPPEEAAEDNFVKETLKEEGQVPPTATEKEKSDTETDGQPEVPDVSPVDIAAAASVVPLPDDADGDLMDTAVADTEEKKTYMKYLFQIAQQTGTGIKDTWFSKMPSLPSSTSSLIPPMPSVSMPSVSLPSVSMPSVSMPSVSMPSVNIFHKKAASTETDATPAEGGEEKQGDGEDVVNKPTTQDS